MMGAIVVGLIVAALLVWVARPTGRRGARAASAALIDDGPSKLLVWAVSSLPADRVQWGEAMFGELQQLQSRRQRWRFAVGCAGATLLLPSRRADSAALAARLVAATALVCAGVVVYSLRRYPAMLAQSGTRPALVMFGTVLVGYALISAVLVRRGPVARSGLVGGLGLAAVWIIAGLLAVSHASQPAYSLLLLTIPLAAFAVGVAAARRATAVVRQPVVLLSAVVAGLILFLVLAGDTLLTAGGPYDAGQLRDFPGSGMPDLATYAVSDNLGSAMMLLLLVPIVTAAIGCAAAGVTAHLRRRRASTG
jgi:hypothetical protein